MAVDEDPARWKRLDKIFGDAADLPLEDRAAFVARACGGDDSLRAEIMALLGVERDAKPALHAIVGAATVTVEPELRSLPPSRATAGNLVIFVTAVVATLALGALIRAQLAPTGAPLSTWTLHVDGASRPMVLPQQMFSHLGFRVVEYTLETELALGADQRGQALTLHVDCFHASLALDVDGASVPDVGDLGIGEHRYVIPAAATDRNSLRLALRATHDLQSAQGFGIAPYVSSGVSSRAPSATFNRWIATIGLVMAGLFTFLFGMMFMLDRRRREYLAWVASTLSASVMGIYILGVLPNAALPARYTSLVLSVCVAAMFLSLDFILRQALHVVRPSRAWPIIFAITIVCGAAVAVIPQAVAALAIATLAYPAFFAYVIIRCIVRGRGDYRADARILLVWASSALVISVIETYWRATGTNLLVGIHGPLLSTVLLSIAQIAVIARQDTARRHTLEHSTEELRRQIAERSKDLAATLARLARDHDAPLVAGRTLGGRYRILRMLGAGGMGTVYEAERVSDRRHVALKTLRGQFDVKQLARLAQEGQLAADIDHPNIVGVIDIGVADGLLFLAMDLVDGGGLDQQRARFGDAAWARPLLAQIASGLAALHARGIVHRDLKPSNILVSGGVVRISDFGISTLYGNRPVGGLDATTPQAPELTRRGDVFGTPMYMGPELAAGADRAAPSSDIFSFGVLAHELLTGHSPFAEPPVLARLRGQPILPEPALVVASDLRAVISRCIGSEPSKRPTADELVATLGTSER